MNLYDSLLKYRDSGYYPMHMPGHKRNTELLAMVDPYSIDITEIEDFDNLHRPEGILKKGMEEWAAFYGSQNSYYLVGGSTAGILTGISACTDRGDKILMARNCHKSVYHAVYLRGLRPVYLYPPVIKEFGIHASLPPERVEEVLGREEGIRLVVITSPTYEGVVSDVKAIAEITHRYGIPLMVDEAHGAHLGFHKSFPEGSVTKGADIVVHSIHKTLPAFTQTALLHVNGSLADKEKIERYLSIYQSSSPSYVLMAGLEKCLELLKSRGRELFDNYSEMLGEFYCIAEELKNIRLLTEKEIERAGSYGFDPSKLVVSVRGSDITGKGLYDALLDPYRIQMEMVSRDYVLGMTSIGDRKEGLDRLAQALLAMDKKMERREGQEEDFSFYEPEAVMTSEKAADAPKREVPLAESEGFVAAEYLYLYPPGIPLLVPGERIGRDLLKEIMACRQKGLTLQGLKDYSGRTIEVVKQGGWKE